LQTSWKTRTKEEIGR